jgi:hypothetical protein
VPTALNCHFTIDAASWPNARDRMVTMMRAMCPGMPFDWQVRVEKISGDQPWRFTFDVFFTVSSHDGG